MSMFFRVKTGEADLVAEPLARSHRKFLFWAAIFVFVIAVPFFVFNAIGYQYDFFDPTGSIVPTGALYVTVPDTTAQIYVNNQAVRDARTFRRASYIQSLTPGQHRVHVLAPQLHTWVKELPVYPHIVTEAEAFLLPVRPQLRLVTEYVNSINNTPLVDEEQFAFLTETATTTILIEVLATSTRTNLISNISIQKPKINPEYVVLEELFTNKATTTTSVVDKVISTAKQAFQFQTSSTTNGLDKTTTTKVQGQFTLFEREKEIIVSYDGSDQDIPYYFCVPHASIASTTEIYGAHVMQGINAVLAVSSADGIVTETSNSNRICRQEILIDRQEAKVYSFDFINVGSGAVILHRQDGVFVTEIDDRSWQNTQKIYGASVEMMVVDNNQVYIKDKQGFYAELLFTLITDSN